MGYGGVPAKIGAGGGKQQVVRAWRKGSDRRKGGQRDQIGGFHRHRLPEEHIISQSGLPDPTESRKLNWLVSLSATKAYGVLRLLTL